MLAEIERFVNWTRRRSTGARTWKDYGYDLRFFVDVVGDRSPKEITFKDIDEFVGVQSEKGFKPSTINRRLASVVALYGFLAAEDEELVCPVIIRRHHVREQQRLPRPVPEEDLKRFFAVITDKRDRAMFLLTRAPPGTVRQDGVAHVQVCCVVDCASGKSPLCSWQICSWTKSIHGSWRVVKAQKNAVCISPNKRKLHCANILQNAPQ